MVTIFKMEAIKHLIPDVPLNEIELRIVDGKHFVFDKESLREFEEYFITDSHYIFLEGGYICRRPKWDKDAKPKNFTFFHRFLIEKDLFDYENNNPEAKRPLQVHHLTWCKRINIKKYLKILPKDIHEIIHEKGLRDRNLMQQSKWLEFDN